MAKKGTLAKIQELQPSFQTTTEQITIGLVVTAMTWSGSVAWRIPWKNPTARMERKLTMYLSGLLRVPLPGAIR
jgi:hypothetical protein